MSTRHIVPGKHLLLVQGLTPEQLANFWPSLQNRLPANSANVTLLPDEAVVVVLAVAVALSSLPRVTMVPWSCARVREAGGMMGQAVCC